MAEAPKDQTERWYDSYCIAYDQAMANGEAAMIARAALQRISEAHPIGTIHSEATGRDARAALAASYAVSASPRTAKDVHNEAIEAAAKVADPPLGHRKGKVGLWRIRRLGIAAAIRALAR